MRSAEVAIIGAGVMHAPALGQLLAEIIADGTTRTPGALRRERPQPGTDALMMYIGGKETT